MLYPVPQTDSTTEAAMAALVLRLRAKCPKPDAIPGNIPWTPGSTYAANAQVVANGGLYKASSPGTSATGPSGTGSVIADGSGGLVWAYQGVDPNITLALICAGWVDRIGSALGNRATLPLLQWDASLDGACVTLATRQYYDERGRNRQAGVDEGIDVQAKEALAYLSRVKPGTPEGVRENPRFVDSGDNAPLDGPFVLSARTSDSYVERREHSGACR